MDISKILHQIAKKNGISVAEVKEEMQKAITAAYYNPSRNREIIERQKCVPHKDDIPTPEEFICYIVDEIKKKN